MGRRCRPRAVILGSRQQMCLNPGVKRLPGGAMNQACRAHVGARTCSWCAPLQTLCPLLLVSHSCLPHRRVRFDQQHRTCKARIPCSLLQHELFAVR